MTASLHDLRDALEGHLVTPEDEGWDAARSAWNLAADLRPACVAYPGSADDVAAVVVFAREHGLRIAFVAGGHNAGTIDWSAPTILLKTERMRDVAVDAVTGRARVGAGVLARELASVAGEHGLAFLSGTSPDVGVLGYALGGGLSWLVRQHGLACNSIVAADVVTADGRIVRVDRDHEPDLFWALRGGGGNVAAVTTLELQLIPLTEVFGGALFWPIERAGEILGAWRRWIETVPETCKSLGRLLQLPDVPFIPEEVRGRSFAMIEAVNIGSEEDGAALVAPLRELGPIMDTFATLPPVKLSRIHMDPEMPLPYAGDGALLTDFPPEAIDRVIDDFVGSPLLHIEVRQLGGAAARPSPDHGVLDAIDQAFVTFVFGLAPTPDAAVAIDAKAHEVLAGLGPWDSGRRYLNFTETPVDPRTIFPSETWERLLRVKSTYDPTDMFQANHPLRRSVTASV